MEVQAPETRSIASVICPVTQFQLLQVQKAEMQHLPLTSEPPRQEIKGKEGSYQNIPRDNATQKRHPPVTRAFFCSAQAISRTSGWHCAKGFLGILQTVRLK